MKLWGYPPERMIELENNLLRQEVTDILFDAQYGKNVNLAYAAHGSAVLHLFYENTE